MEEAKHGGGERPEVQPRLPLDATEDRADDMVREGVDRALDEQADHVVGDLVFERGRNRNVENRGRAALCGRVALCTTRLILLVPLQPLRQLLDGVLQFGDRRRDHAEGHLGEGHLFAGHGVGHVSKLGTINPSFGANFT